MDPMVLYGAAAFAASFVLRQKRQKKKKEAIRRRVGTNIRVRIRRSIESVYHEIGDELFRRAYRMTSTTRRGAAANEQLESEDNMFDSTCFKPMM
jgi:hypothetical protein